MMVVNGGRNINLVLSYTNNIDVINYSAMAGKAVLICQQNSHSFLDRTLNLEQPVKIGRSVARARAAQNNGIFDCKVLSRNHALFWYANGKFFLQDTKSSNGTFVNNQRLSKSGEESSPREVCSGDIVQFGVDVLENSRKVTHGCIVASLKLYLPDGKEAKASPSTAVLSCVGSVPVEDLYQLNQHIQEALQREQMLQTKLSSLQQLVMSLQQASDLSWKALIAEDRLLSRVETLETQLQTYSKNFGEDKLREELRKLNEDKNCYQTTAKECLKKILEEKVEANQKCEDIKISLMNTEAECANFKELMEQSHGELRELALKHSAQTAKNEELQDKLQASEDQLKDVTSKLESVKEELNHELQKLVGNEVVLQERINKLEVTSQMEVREYKIEPKPRSILEQFTAIYDHLPEFNTDETSDDQDIYLERIDDDEAQDDPRDISSRVDRLFDQLITVFQDQQKTKEVVDILAAQLNFLQGERGAKLQRITALENELELHSSQLRTFRNDNVILEHKLNSLHEIVEAEIQSPDCDVTMKIETEEMVTKSTLYNLQAEMSELKELLTEAQKKSEIAEQKVKVLQIDLDLAKNSLSETTENLTRTKEKLQDAEKIKEGRDTTVALLKQQMKTIETSRMETTLQEKLEVQHNSINKQEEETLLLKKQLLESQHVAKQHKNEIEQLKEQLLVLAEEHEGKLNDDTTDNWENSLDNRAREDFSALQQECSTLKETIKTLESQLLKLKTESRLNQELLETRRSIEEAENESAAMKIDKEIAMEDNKEEMEISRIKISELEEELVLVKERYVSCNEDKTRLEKEFTLLKQDFQGVSQQSSYFNFVCALPLLILFIAFTIAFYPTLSCLFGTTDKPQPPLD